MNPTSIHEDMGLIPSLSQGWGSCIAVSCGLGHRHSSDPALLWLWCRLAAATLIQPLALELQYDTGVTLKSKKKKKKKTHFQHYYIYH